MPCLAHNHRTRAEWEDRTDPATEIWQDDFAGGGFEMRACKLCGSHVAEPEFDPFGPGCADLEVA